MLTDLEAKQLMRWRAQHGAMTADEALRKAEHAETMAEGIAVSGVRSLQDVVDKYRQESVVLLEYAALVEKAGGVMPWEVKNPYCTCLGMPGAEGDCKVHNL
jgi:hypothetical protein